MHKKKKVVTFIEKPKNNYTKNKTRLKFQTQQISNTTIVSCNTLTN